MEPFPNDPNRGVIERMAHDLGEQQGNITSILNIVIENLTILRGIVTEVTPIIEAINQGINNPTDTVHLLDRIRDIQRIVRLTQRQFIRINRIYDTIKRIDPAGSTHSYFNFLRNELYINRTGVYLQKLNHRYRLFSQIINHTISQGNGGRLPISIE